MAIAPTVAKPSFEHHHDGFGLGYSQPRISWQFVAPPTGTIQGWKQTSYQIELTWLASGLAENFSVQGRPLESRERVSVRVQCTGNGDQGDEEPVATGWSEPGIVEAGLLGPHDWTASFMTASTRIGPKGPLQPLRFRREFTLPPRYTDVSRARLYITALGVFKAYINGQPTSDEEMAPGWTSYKNRLSYSVHDVTSLVSPCENNAIAIEAAEGWYAGLLGFHGGERFIYGGDEIGVLAQLEVSSAHVREHWMLTSGSDWICCKSAIQSSEIYDGEVFDDRREVHRWNDLNLGENSGAWIPTKNIGMTTAKLVAPNAPPVRVTQKIDAIDVFRTKSGKIVVDFGQNLVGKVQVKDIRIPAGESIVFKHAEVMEHDELGTRPLRLAKATDTFISSGRSVKNWTPQFTFHGFRYLQVDGWPSGGPDGALPPKENFTALVLHTDLRRRGTFSCSNEMVDQLHRNVVWSMRGNFFSIPTDCPQRNERLGWTGDLQVFCPTASYLYDTVGMLADWMQDVVADQMQEGRGGIPNLVCPEIQLPGWPHMAAAVWDDIVVLTPYVLYEYARDENILREHFESMRAWLERGVRRGPDGLWDPDHWQLGDWLDPKAPPEDPANGTTNSVMVADAYLIHTSAVFSLACRAIGKTAEADKYELQVAELKQKFQDKYITPAGYLFSDTQTGIALATQYSLYRNADEMNTAATRLKKLVQTARFNIATGFAGTPIIAHALTKLCLPQFAYRMLLEKSCPSWLYPVTMGATTTWERWDSMLPDGSINPGSMTSFNHYALGSVADWLHGTVGGISPAEPGWKTILVRPIPGGNVTYAEASFDGPYGLVSCHWQLEDGIKFRMSLTVPPNSRAKVILPSDVRTKPGEAEEERFQIVGSGTHQFQCEFHHAEEWPPKRLIAPHIQSPPPELIAE
ncbi:bacterial alpha-L-rhamnosidase-domain-containing protein [Xylariales sp. PMI_506]|nr:bacterial alpha-L-rhamnosidase-domain-containing protein [Xylariales sp. PMI_506]